MPVLEEGEIAPDDEESAAPPVPEPELSQRISKFDVDAANAMQSAIDYAEKEVDADNGCRQ